MNIQKNLKLYLNDRRPTARYASFDYCFNYFRSFHERGQSSALADPVNLQWSCLHLSFYLASWGMFRASSILLQRSARHFIPVIKAIAAAPRAIWNIDAHSYTSENIAVLIEAAGQIRSAFPEPASDILVTKIMLGVYGCVPAFDTNFKAGFGVWTFNEISLQKVATFYETNAVAVDLHRVTTLEFSTGMATKRRYTRAKVIDMIFFIEGGSVADTK